MSILGASTLRFFEFLDLKETPEARGPQKTTRTKNELVEDLATLQ